MTDKERVLAKWLDARIVSWRDGACAVYTGITEDPSCYIGWGQVTASRDGYRADAEAWADAASRLKPCDAMGLDTYGDLRREFPMIADGMEPHEWDNMNRTEQLRWALGKMDRFAGLLADEVVRQRAASRLEPEQAAPQPASDPRMEEIRKRVREWNATGDVAGGLFKVYKDCLWMLERIDQLEAHGRALLERERAARKGE